MAAAKADRKRTMTSSLFLAHIMPFVQTSDKRHRRGEATRMNRRPLLGSEERWLNVCVWVFALLTVGRRRPPLKPSC